MPETRDWDARDYAAHSAAQQEWARELVAKLRLRGDEAVLDICCGDGRATALIAERLPDGSVLGVDKSASMIALAREQFAPAAHPGLSFLQIRCAALSQVAADLLTSPGRGPAEGEALIAWMKENEDAWRQTLST